MEFKNSLVANHFEKRITNLAGGVREFPWHDKQAYAQWLAQSHYLVCHTSTFLSLVAAKLGPEPSQRHRDVLKHLREETGHEELPLRDMEFLGYSIIQFPQLLETALLFQSQYYWLDRAGAIAHVGYSLMLEGLAVREGKWIFETVSKHFGKKAGSFIQVHAEDDIGHFAEGLSRLNGATPEQIAQVLSNLDQSCALYHRILTQIARRAVGESERREAA